MGVGKNTDISGFSNRNSNIYFTRLKKKRNKEKNIISSFPLSQNYYTRRKDYILK